MHVKGKQTAAYLPVGMKFYFSFTICTYIAGTECRHVSSYETVGYVHIITDHTVFIIMSVLCFVSMLLMRS